MSEGISHSCFVCKKEGTVVYSIPGPDGVGGIIRELKIACDDHAPMLENQVKGMGLVEGIGFEVMKVEELEKK